MNGVYSLTKLVCNACGSAIASCRWYDESQTFLVGLAKLFERSLQLQQRTPLGDVWSPLTQTEGVHSEGLVLPVETIHGMRYLATSMLNWLQFFILNYEESVDGRGELKGSELLPSVQYEPATSFQ